MAKMTKWTTHPFSGTLLVCLISLVSQSPCPEHFRYYRNETTSELMATVEISKVPYGVPLHLKVVLSVPTILPTVRMAVIQKEQKIILKFQRF